MSAVVGSIAGTAMIFPGGWEVMVIGGIVLVLFGASAIPKFARSIGKAKREFEKGIDEGGRSEPDQLKDPAKAKEDQAEEQGN